MIKSKIIKNASWIIVCKIIQSLIGLVISMITARYLGPDGFGLINYASSIAAFLIPIMQLGLSNVLVQELTVHPEKEGVILGTSITFSVISSLFCILGSFAFSSFANAGEKDTILVCVLYSMQLLFQATELIEYWFQSKLLSKYSSIASICAYFIVALYKIYLLASSKSIYWFATINSLDFFLISCFLLICYRKKGGGNLKFSFAVGKDMLSRSKHYILSNLMIAVFSQTDRIMLKLMIGESATGFYSAAFNCANIASFVFSAIIDSMRPVIFESKKKNTGDYENNIKVLYSIVIYLSLAQSIFMTVLAKPIVLILYGSEYFKSISALRILVWYSTFSYVGGIRNIWLLGEQKQNQLWKINLSGAVCNVLLNYLLIPRIGVNGAAIATLVTEFFSNIILTCFIRQISYNNKLILNSLNPKLIVRFFRSELFE